MILDVHDQAAALIIAALRGEPAADDTEARARQELGEQMADALWRGLSCGTEAGQ